MDDGDADNGDADNGDAENDDGPYFGPDHRPAVTSERAPGDFTAIVQLLRCRSR